MSQCSEHVTTEHVIPNNVLSTLPQKTTFFFSCSGIGLLL